MADMILNNDMLQKYKEYLILLDYPFIKQQNDVEIQKIFEKDNRILLLSWLVGKYLPSCTNKIEEAKKDNKIENFLTNIIYDNGFCRSSEKDSFVKGILEDDKQISIFNKIFSMLSLLHSNNTVQENMSEEDLKLKYILMKDLEQLKTKLNLGINLYPTIGLPSKLSITDRKNKLDSYKEEIDNLKNILELEEKDDKSSATEIFSDSACNVEEIDKLALILKKNLSEFNTDDFVNFTNNKTGNVTSSNVNLENLVGTNSKEICSLLKTLEKKQDLKKIITEDVIENQDVSIADDFSASILQNFVMSNKIIEEADRNAEN